MLVPHKKGMFCLPLIRGEKEHRPRLGLHWQPFGSNCDHAVTLRSLYSHSWTGDNEAVLWVLPFSTVHAFSPLQPEEEQLVCDITGSSSSTDDTASLDRHSSHGSDVSLPQISNLNRSRDQQCLDSFYSHGAGAEGRESEGEAAGSGEMDEEEMDSITEVPTNRSVLRGSMRSLSPFRRHSWGPGKNAASDAEMNQRR